MNRWSLRFGRIVACAVLGAAVGCNGGATEGPKTSSGDPGKGNGSVTRNPDTVESPKGNGNGGTTGGTSTTDPAGTVDVADRCTAGSATPGGAPAPEVEFPNGDPSVSADDGGPGFTGEGWQTVKPYPLGDVRAVKGGTITSMIREWPGNLRMAGTGYNTWLNYTVRDLCYMGLLNLDPNTLEYIPALASHWKLSDDQMTFSYRIDPRAHWSDGKPVVAQDVVASWALRMDETLLDPSAVLTYGKLEKPVAKSKYLVEVKAKDRNWRNFLYFSSMAIFPAHEVGHISGKDYLDKYNYAYTAVTGPYVVQPADIDKGNSLTLTRRCDFWGKDDAWYQGMYNFDRIRFVVVLDEETAFQKAIKGELDLFYVQRSEWWAKDLPDLAAVKNGWLVRQKIFNDAPNGLSGFAMNTRHAPLDDLRVRQALQLAYDRKTLIRTLAYDEYVPTNSFHPGSEYENPDNVQWDYDPAKAIELLEQAGWDKTGGDGIRVKDGKRLALKLTWYSQPKEKFLTSYKETCRKIGVEIELDRSNPETVWKNLMERNFEMVSIGWGGLLFPNDETSLHSRLAEQNDNNNITGFANARCDELFKEYDLAFTQEQRRKIVREIDGIVTKELPYVMEWYQPCQRIIYWNRYGMPEYGLHRTLEWEDAYATWWLDPSKDEQLRTARRKRQSLPVPPLENRYWLEQRAATKQASSN